MITWSSSFCRQYYTAIPVNSDLKTYVCFSSTTSTGTTYYDTSCMEHFTKQTIVNHSVIIEIQKSTSGKKIGNNGPSGKSSDCSKF